MTNHAQDDTACRAACNVPGAACSVPVLVLSAGCWVLVLVLVLVLVPGCDRASRLTNSALLHGEGAASGLHDQPDLAILRLTERKT